MLQFMGLKRVGYDIATEQQLPSSPEAETPVSGLIIKSWGLLEKVVVTQRQIPTAREESLK